MIRMNTDRLDGWGCCQSQGLRGGFGRLGNDSLLGGSRDEAAAPLVPAVGEAFRRVHDAGLGGELGQRAIGWPDQTKPRWQLAKGTERGLGQDGGRRAIMIHRAVQLQMAHPDAQRHSDRDESTCLVGNPVCYLGRRCGDGDATELKAVRIGWVRAGGDTSQGTEFQGFAHGLMSSGMPPASDVRRTDIRIKRLLLPDGVDIVVFSDVGVKIQDG